MAVLTVDFRKHSGPTPADVTAAQTITDWKLHTGLKQHGCCVSPLFLQTLVPWITNDPKYTLIWKEDFGALSNSPVLYLLIPGKTPLTMFLFQKWLVALFLKIWAWWLLMHWLQLQFTPCEALPSVWIGFAWQYSQACAHPCCLSTFISNVFLPVNFAFNMLWYSTPWTAPPPPPPSVMPLCDSPSLLPLTFWNKLQEKYCKTLLLLSYLV